MKPLPPCGHTGWTRQSRDIPPEYAHMCDDCVTSYAITHGILFTAPQHAEQQREAEPG